MAQTDLAGYVARAMDGIESIEIRNSPPRVPSSIDSIPAIPLEAKGNMAAARILIIDDEEPTSRDREREPDLVLTDWLMPHCDGAAVIAQLNSLMASDDYLPIVVLTAGITQQTKRRALAAGRQGFFDQALRSSGGRLAHPQPASLREHSTSPSFLPSGRREKKSASPLIAMNQQPKKRAPAFSSSITIRKS